MLEYLSANLAIGPGNAAVNWSIHSPDSRCFIILALVPDVDVGFHLFLGRVQGESFIVCTLGVRRIDVVAIFLFLYSNNSTVTRKSVTENKIKSSVKCI